MWTWVRPSPDLVTKLASRRIKIKQSVVPTDKFSHSSYWDTSICILPQVLAQVCKNNVKMSPTWDLVTKLSPKRIKIKRSVVPTDKFSHSSYWDFSRCKLPKVLDQVYKNNVNTSPTCPDLVIKLASRRIKIKKPVLPTDRFLHSSYWDTSRCIFPQVLAQVYKNNVNMSPTCPWSSNQTCFKAHQDQAICCSDRVSHSSHWDFSRCMLPNKWTRTMWTWVPPAPDLVTNLLQGASRSSNLLFRQIFTFLSLRLLKMYASESSRSSVQEQCEHKSDLPLI